MSEQDASKQDDKDLAGDPKKPDADGGQQQSPEPEEDDEKMTVSKSKWNQLWKRAKTAEAGLKQTEDDKEAKARKQLEEDGKYKELISTLEQDKTDLDQKVKNLTNLETTLQKYLDSEMEKIPEDKHSLIPDVPVNEKLEYIIKNKSHLISSEKTNSGEGNLPKGGTNVPLTEIAKKEARMDEIRKKRVEGGYVSEQEKKEHVRLGREITELKKQEIIN